MDTLLQRITIDPAICNGKPTIRHQRMTVGSVLEFLSLGDSKEEILHQYPFLEPADIDACLLFASRMMDNHYDYYEIAS